MTIPRDYSFPRYLAAKKTVDDRALHPHVWRALAEHLAGQGQALRVLEVGAGIGTMLERILEWGLIERGTYLGLDSQAANIAAARSRLPEWGRGHGYQVAHQDEFIHLSRQGQTLAVALEAVDLFDFIAREAGEQQWDLVIAHAFLDLMDVPATLPQLFRLLRPGGCFYFTINFDGVTTFEPQVDPVLDELIPQLYHQTMDARMTAGNPSGDSRAGRHLFTHLKQAGADIFAAAGSDWVVYPSQGGYPGDEAYFLHHILHFIETSLRNHPRLDAEGFQRWLAQRRDQVERGKLVYIAHQLDFAGHFSQDAIES